MDVLELGDFPFWGFIAFGLELEFIFRRLMGTLWEKPDSETYSSSTYLYGNLCDGNGGSTIACSGAMDEL